MKMEHGPDDRGQSRLVSFDSSAQARDENPCARVDVSGLLLFSPFCDELDPFAKGSGVHCALASVTVMPQAVSPQ
jgi:hypothetical protein